MSKLSMYLQKKLVGYGERARFSERLGISASSVTKWASGENAPDFENCLRIADYFGLDPRSVFEMARRSDYLELYERFFARVGQSQHIESSPVERYRGFYTAFSQNPKALEKK